jgi:hypothetical protein
MLTPRLPKHDTSVGEARGRFMTTSNTCAMRE